jgi:putative heme-binding domain-containing protein
MITEQDRNSLTLRMPDSDMVVSKSMIKKRETLSHSVMPSGLLDNLTREERRDLIAYLMHPSQVE